MDDMENIVLDAAIWALFACFVVAVILLGLTCFAVYVIYNLPMNLWRVVKGETNNQS